MNSSPKKIAISGAGGQIAYNLVFRIAAGELYGPNQAISLHLLETEQGMKALKALEMELCDCAFPLLQNLIMGFDAREVFKDVERAILIGAKPRQAGMERKDLLFDNGRIFSKQGKALNEVASRDLITLVVGNPCNSNCLICIHNCPDLPAKNFHALMRLDQNRSWGLLAKKCQIAAAEISAPIIWGNHSSTQVPDFNHITHLGTPLQIERSWLENEFMQSVRQRGAAVIKARGHSSAASAAQAILDQLNSIEGPCDLFSSAVYSVDNPYGIDPDLVFSFPCRSQKGGQCEIIAGYSWDAFIEGQIRISEKELIEERTQISSILESKAVL